MAILQKEGRHHQHDNTEGNEGNNSVNLIQPSEINEGDLDRHHAYTPRLRETPWPDIFL